MTDDSAKYDLRNTGYEVSERDYLYLLTILIIIFQQPL